jgi:hypothetical protein
VIFRVSPKILRKFRDPDIVSASEIASYAFCPEAWRLGSALGLTANNERELTRGEKTHENFAAAEQASHSAIWIGLALIVLGALLVGVFRLVTGR